MSVNPYIFFNGNCEEAFKFYARIAGGKIETMMPHAGTPAESHVPAEWKSKIMHARMTIAGSLLMASDAPPGHYNKPQGFSVSLQVKTPAEGERIFNALADGGKVNMPFQKTFWSPGFGMVVDRYDIPWMINCDEALA
jgi:PhnB protein